MQVSLKRRRIWLWVAVVILAVLTAFTFCLLVSWTEKGVTDANVRRIEAGMSREEVEALLGPPNNLPDLKQKNMAFWDRDYLFRYRYVAITVYYDDEGRVDHTKVTTFWR